MHRRRLQIENICDCMQINSNTALEVAYCREYNKNASASKNAIHQNHRALLENLTGN
jgi:hypothetical protein